MLKCSQKQPCDDPPCFRYAWPGRNEAYACATRASTSRDSVGLHLQLIPLDIEDWLKEAKEEPNHV